MYLMKKLLAEKDAEVSSIGESEVVEEHSQEPESSQGRRTMRSSEVSSRNPASKFRFDLKMMLDFILKLPD